MPTRNVVLTEHHATIIDRLVTSGRYESASDVLREGLRLVERNEHLDAVKLDALRDAAKVGFGDLDDGRFTDIRDEVLDDVIGDLGRRAETSRP